MRYGDKCDAIREGENRENSQEDEEQAGMVIQEYRPSILMLN